MVVLVRDADASKEAKVRVSYRFVECPYVLSQTYFGRNASRSRACSPEDSPTAVNPLLLASTIEAHLITLTQSVESRTFQGIRSRHEAQVDRRDD